LVGMRRSNTGKMGTVVLFFMQLPVKLTLRTESFTIKFLESLGIFPYPETSGKWFKCRAFLPQSLCPRLSQAGKKSVLLPFCRKTRRRGPKIPPSSCFWYFSPLFSWYRVYGFVGGLWLSWTRKLRACAPLVGSMMPHPGSQ